MSKENQQPPRGAAQPLAPKVVLQSVSAQEQKPVTKPDKNVLAPKSEMKCFSCSENEE
jgi:hypothetical protein